ncbi:MAG: hypothetical protein ACRCTR_02680 [Actinomycetota bacterium]
MTTPRHKLRVPGTLSALAIAALVLAGCGGDDSSDTGVASVAGSSNTASASATAQSAEEKEAAALKYVECLRGEGLDVPDPQVDENGNLRLRPPGGRGGGGQGGGIDREAFQKAQDACGEVPEGLGGQIDQNDPEFQDAVLKFAECMRGEGIDIGDPDFSGGGGPGGLFQGLDLQDPKVQEATEQCRSALADVAPGGGQ